MAMAKWNWTQSSEALVILISTPFISPSDVEVSFTESSVSVSVSLPSGSELSYDFDPLAHAVEPELCSWTISNDRSGVEITLRKREIGRSWLTLEAGDFDDTGSSTSAQAPSDSLSLQVMSDLHLEFHFRTPPRGSKQGYYVFEPPVSAPNLALLGDIGLVQHDGLFSFLEEQLRRFDRVLFLLGNHEFYGRAATYDETVLKVQAFAERMQRAAAIAESKLGEFIFLNRTRYDVPDSQVSILGCTLWSDVPPEAAKAVQSGLNDFKEISGWSLERHVQAHAEDVAWLSAQLAQLRADSPGRRAVVLTHHAPTLVGTSDRKHAGSPATAGFATELSTRAEVWAGPTVWAFGHTHHCCDFVLNGVRVYSNQRGYEGDEAKQSGFRPEAVIHV